MGMTSSQYAQVIQQMLPKGRAWVRSAVSNIFNLLLGMSDELALVDATVVDFQDEVDPRTTTNFITDWENMVSLPDSVQAISPFIDERRSDVTRKLTDPGGQNAAYFISTAAYFGYAITVSVYPICRAGVMRAGQPVYGPGWAYYFQVKCPAVVVRYMCAGQVVGQPIATWRNQTLEAAIRRICQAHETPIFTYGS